MVISTSRREFLGLVGATTAVVSLAACSSGSKSDDASTDAADSATGAPTATAVSTIFGSADTGNKSTLKKTLQKTSGPGDINIYHYDDDGNRVAYPDDTVLEMPGVSYVGEATISLEGDDIDDSLIDASAATVSIAEGDGYYADELLLGATTLDGAWQDGRCTYTLSEGDLTWNMGDYPLADENSGREWSVFGGDGNGCYTFNFEVNGIRYDGAEVDPVTFPVQVYIWGRDATDLMDEFNATPDPVAEASSSGVAQTDEVQWVWIADDGQAELCNDDGSWGAGTQRPALCDDQADDFFIVWPEGSDASGATTENVTVTLTGAYGDTLELTPDEQFEVFSSEGETQVAITLMNWPYTPVYTKMTISVEVDDLAAEKTFDVASVYVYMVQQGGGGVTVDGTVTAYSYYGFDNLDDVKMILDDASYVLSVERDGATYYFAENEDGTGSLVEDSAEATSYDASGEDECNERLVVNTAYVTTRVDQTEDREVDGETITFTKEYDTRVTKDAAAAIEAGLEPADGFAIGDTITPHEAWPWQDRFLAGWTPDKPAPEAFPYTTFPYGF